MEYRLLLGCCAGGNMFRAMWRIPFVFALFPGLCIGTYGFGSTSCQIVLPILVSLLLSFYWCLLPNISLLLVIPSPIIYRRQIHPRETEVTIMRWYNTMGAEGKLIYLIVTIVLSFTHSFAIAFLHHWWQQQQCRSQWKTQHQQETPSNGWVLYFMFMISF